MYKPLLFAAGALLLLSGCGSQAHSTTSSSSKPKTSQTSTTKKTAKSSQSTTSSATSSSTTKASSTASHSTLAWSATQDAKLASFMQTFGAKMNQNYTQFKQSAEFEWYGLELNHYFAGHPSLLVDGQTTAINWMPTAGHFSQSAANIVAAYADTQDRILYFFAIDADGTTHAWVTQQAGTPFNAKPTANTEVSGAFKQIVAGQTPATPVGKTGTASASSSSVDMQNLSTAQAKDWILRNIQKYSPTTYPNYSADAFGWQFGKDGSGQLQVTVTEDHAYMNAHYGTNGDPSTAPTVGIFTITSGGQLQAQGVGSVGMTMVQKVTGSMTGTATIAKSFSE